MTILSLVCECEYSCLQETDSGERIKQLLAQLSQSSQTLEDSEQRDARFRAIKEEVTKLRADNARLEADLKAANQELGAQNIHIYIHAYFTCRFYAARVVRL